MSLKELIRSLIAPLSARPKSQFYQTITPSSGQTASYTMPVDGWVQLYGENPTGSEQTVQLWGGDRLATSTTVQSPAKWSSSAIGFYRKGDLIFYSISGFSEMTLNIFALVGGGYLSYFATLGGGLWLRLNHFLSRFSSSLAGKRTSTTNIRAYRSKKVLSGGKNTLLHQMDMSVFGGTATHQFRLETLTLVSSLVHKLALLLELFFLSEKERNFSRLSHTLMIRRRHTDFTYASARLDFCEGGAL